MEFYMVKPRDSIRKTAKTVYAELCKNGCVELQAKGTSAVNNAVKSATKAVGMAFLSQKSAACTVTYGKYDDEGRSVDTVRIRVKMT